jgi:curved DNA-binding protein CbpA
VEDYYAILGLDRGASKESVRIAFRSLARQTHPDFQANSSEDEQSLRSRQMARLNEAYRVLHDVERRRQYDEQLRLQDLFQTKESVSTVSASRTSATATGRRTGTRSQLDANHSVVKGFTDQLRAGFLSRESTFSWKQQELEGFDWALQTSTWTSTFWVAARAYDPANASAVKSFLAYSETAMARHKSHLRKGHFLFLLPFRQLCEWDTISVQCQGFVFSETRKESPVGIILLDLQHAKTLRFADSKGQSKQFRELIEWVGNRV